MTLAMDCDDELAGLRSVEVAQKLQLFGRNEILERQKPWFILLVRQFLAPIPLALAFVCVLAALISVWEVFGSLLVILLANVSVAFFEKRKKKYALEMGNAARDLGLVLVKRDGTFVPRADSELVPGDVIFLRGGDIVPADCEFIYGDELLVDTVLLDGEPGPRQVPRPARELLTASMFVEAGGLRVFLTNLVGASVMDCNFEADDATTIHDLETKVLSVITRPTFFTDDGFEVLKTDCLKDHARLTLRSGGGKDLLSGHMIREGEAMCVVRKTGLATEIAKVGGFHQEKCCPLCATLEEKVERAFSILIFISAINGMALLLYEIYVIRKDLTNSMMVVLSVSIAAFPYAFPVVTHITMAHGTSVMATQHALATSLSAVQKLASMTALCADKTGTLTNANMRVVAESIWTKHGHTQKDVLTWAAVSSYRGSTQDWIDRSVHDAARRAFRRADKALLAFADQLGGEGEAGNELAAHSLCQRKSQSCVNFTNKWSVVHCEHPELRRIQIATGDVSKLFGTGDFDRDDCFEVEDPPQIRNEVQQKDKQYTMRGYKTTGVAIARDDEPMSFAGIIPMFDLPRDDTQTTIHRIRMAGIDVKMVTGDNLNIAIETGRLCGLGTRILSAREDWSASKECDRKINEADGFAELLPENKCEIVAALQRAGHIVGISGDGVSDAVALAKADLGIAVHDAADACQSVADIVLTRPGLSALFCAVVQARKVIERLRTYALWRMVATIQLVAVLSVLIYFHDIVIHPFYMLLLALVSDISMVTISSDNTIPYHQPDVPSIQRMLPGVMFYSGLLTFQSLAFFEYGLNSDWLAKLPGKEITASPSPCDYLTTTLFLQIFLAIEFTIISCRARGFFFAPKYLYKDGRVSCPLLGGIVLASILTTILAGTGVVGFARVRWSDITFIWVYDLLCVLVIDIIKVTLMALGIPLMSSSADADELSTSIETHNSNCLRAPLLSISQ